MRAKAWFCHLSTKQTEDGGPGQRKPLAATTLQQHQKPSETVEFLPELRTMKKPNLPIQVPHACAHTLHLLNGANQRKCQRTHYVGLGKV